jgi:hypothetical protein
MAVAPGRVRIGMRVAARIAAIGDAAQVVFEPAEDLA